MDHQKEKFDLAQEKKLVERANKDPQAFGELFEKYYSKILNYIVRRVGKIELAQDLTSEVFLKALDKLWQFRWRNIPFSAWLFKIAHNEINLYFRKNKHTIISLEKFLEENYTELPSAFDLKEELLEAEKLLEAHTDFLIIRKCLSGMTTKYQEVLALRFFEKKKLREIAVILGKPQGTIKALLSRGVDILREEVKRQNLMQQFSQVDIVKNEKLNFLKRYEE